MLYGLRLEPIAFLRIAVPVRAVELHHHRLVVVRREEHVEPVAAVRRLQRVLLLSAGEDELEFGEQFRLLPGDACPLPAARAALPAHEHVRHLGGPRVVSGGAQPPDLHVGPGGHLRRGEGAVQERDGTLMPGRATNTELDRLLKTDARDAEILYLRSPTTTTAASTWHAAALSSAQLPRNACWPKAWSRLNKLMADMRVPCGRGYARGCERGSESGS